MCWLLQTVIKKIPKAKSLDKKVEKFLKSTSLCCCCHCPRRLALSIPIDVIRVCIILIPYITKLPASIVAVGQSSAYKQDGGVQCGTNIQVSSSFDVGFSLSNDRQFGTCSS